MVCVLCWQSMSRMPYFPTSKQRQSIYKENDMLDRLQEFLTDLENNEDALEGLDLFDD